MTQRSAEAVQTSYDNDILSPSHVEHPQKLRSIITNAAHGIDEDALALGLLDDILLKRSGLLVL